MNNRATLLRSGSAVVSLIDVNPQGHHRVLAIRFIATQAIQFLERKCACVPPKKKNLDSVDLLQKTMIISIGVT